MDSGENNLNPIVITARKALELENKGYENMSLDEKGEYLNIYLNYLYDEIDKNYNRSDHPH